ncbi:uncharacterized protein SPAPADRAFT_60381 [Spathaspora passalidarum NRRL Y-27907]|uniref:Uncharacterized protein n=1 Tax=Spathaspora passalidarum (strain NRRL Y-27907 / 11-Y1) TaxID=619300 RepID=G3AL22_SPAPN|nr:uncharacterized protein SPAPADRAFT_60381 [Spathaspora passalidarum NRRL Y-27907]EGW33065.1 hypothetical protein SPAPADRAFT_60381 [Spathaspora passalidarum NRRL Y-27907]
MNFYRFTAYNLITISLQAEPPKIIDSYNRLADIHLKILLSFPNLNLNAYSEIKLEQQGETGYTAPPPHGGERGFAPPGGFRDKREDFIMSISERQELSLMYILNSLLSLRSITKFVDTSPLYKSELSFLAKSLSSSLSRDIDELASQPTSTHSSVVSFPQLNQLEKEKSLDFMQRKMINNSVLIHGSYKEKLGNIVKLCNFLNDGNLTIPALCQKYHSTISESTHGTESLRFAVEAVLKLLILLSLERISNGVNSISVVNLRKLFFIDGSIEDVFKVKKVLDYEIQVQNGDEVLVLSKNKGVKSMDLIIQDQLEINRLSQKLKELAT